MAALSDFPSDADAQYSYAVGRRLFIQHVGGAALSQLKNGSPDSGAVLTLFGALLASGEMLAAAVGDRASAATEAMAIPYLRAGFCKSDVPINEDGSLWSFGER